MDDFTLGHGDSAELGNRGRGPSLAVAESLLRGSEG